MGFCTTRHWQTSGRLVQELNICTVYIRHMILQWKSVMVHFVLCVPPILHPSPRPQTSYSLCLRRGLSRRAAPVTSRMLQFRVNTSGICRCRISSTHRWRHTSSAIAYTQYPWPFRKSLAQVGNLVAREKAEHLKTIQRILPTVPTFNSCTKFAGSPGIIHDHMPDCHPLSWVWMHAWPHN